jgi:hypothetical protein
VNRGVYLLIGGDEVYLGTVEDILDCEREEEGISKELFYAVHDAINELVSDLNSDDDKITLTIELR